ncbi:MAG TPA: lamin tail domain-containing protein [Flavisolibacter sp.]|nr:lamin tail domain-containing protein [Flavisolibacter sp.]
MKTKLIHILLFGAAFLIAKGSYGQGRVVINEYMPWTLNGCGATAEFVELMNFGPGPVDIGCYILTDGDFSVTIPPNTILQPGEYYVLAGQDVITGPCANIDSTITADLNWNSCHCTSGTIPTTGDGFFTDGGSANEQVVLLSPDLKVVDAVIRSFPAEVSSDITTSNETGCTVMTFNLDKMAIAYETLGMSTGRGNSFARKLDGDCGWVKDPQQSANATNNTPGDASDVTYEFSYVTATDCSGNHGSISIHVKRNNYTDFFPMTYSIVFDSDKNGRFDLTDQYTYGVDNSPPDIFISNLPEGRYRITVESVLGCSLKSFDFQILPCQPVLPVKLVYFRDAGTTGTTRRLEWKIAEAELLQAIILEKARPGEPFTGSQNFSAQPGATGFCSFSAFEPVSSGYQTFRLKIISKDGSFSYGPVIHTGGAQGLHRVTPNPASDQLVLELISQTTRPALFSIYSIAGQRVLSGRLDLNRGHNTHKLFISQLPPGIYQFEASGDQPISFRFVKR